MNHLRLVAFDDAVVIGEEEERFGIGVLRRADGGADGTDVVAQMRDAGSGYTGQNSFLLIKMSLRHQCRLKGKKMRRLYPIHNICSDGIGRFPIGQIKLYTQIKKFIYNTFNKISN
ncbi:hypothetical protein NEILACOT_05021 [Neisseria lactamica ATCC 23970]|uniref:Uncharacterized protein n=1 Tax=Neisseria lactamica ATCC 23970 TaxID=546265 RepID=D0WBU5_NEILA|nr:hypothetical protein NEILACOT_05021 [Neisseria lactamica ATCC 23970]